MPVEPIKTRITTPSAPVAPKLAKGELGLGSKGPKVVELQELLNLVNKAALVADGDFGPATEKAVKAFQKRIGFPENGIAGPGTRRALRVRAKKLQPSGGVPSAIKLNTKVVPRPKSTLPGFSRSVEQCGEFVYRYFKENGHGWPDYPTLGQPAEYIRGGKYKKSHPAYSNGSRTPPRAGDILAATGPAGSGMYHTALIYKVEPKAVWVYQANVPLRNASPDPKDHMMKLPLRRTPDGRWEMPPLPTSKLGYSRDMTVTGWIHPAGSSRLPGAPA